MSDIQVTNIIITIVIGVIGIVAARVNLPAVVAATIVVCIFLVMPWPHSNWEKHPNEDSEEVRKLLISSENRIKTWIMIWLAIFVTMNVVYYSSPEFVSDMLVKSHVEIINKAQSTQNGLKRFPIPNEIHFDDLHPYAGVAIKGQIEIVPVKYVVEIIVDKLYNSLTSIMMGAIIMLFLAYVIICFLEKTIVYAIHKFKQRN